MWIPNTGPEKGQLQVVSDLKLPFIMLKCVQQADAIAEHSVISLYVQAEYTENTALL